MKPFRGVRFDCNAVPPNNIRKPRLLFLFRIPFLAFLLLTVGVETVLAGKKDASRQANISPGFFSPFGPVSDISLDGDPLDIAFVKGRSRNVIAVLTHSAVDVDFYWIDSAGVFKKSSSAHLSLPMAYCFPSDINNDGREDLVFRSSQGSKCILLERFGNSWREHVVSLPENTKQFIVADINNDKRPDILAFGKSTTGLTVVYGKPNMKFKQPVLLLPDISISDLVIADLNDDRIADMALVNWLSEELMVFYGIGRGVFSEQVTAKLGNEPALLALQQKKKERTFRIAVTLPSAKEVIVLEGNAAGEFVTQQRIGVPRTPTGVMFIDANGDNIKDLVLTSDSEVYFSSATSGSLFEKLIPYGVGTNSGWAVGDVDGDGDPEVVAGDASSSRLVVLGGALKRNGGWPDQYSTGSQPLGLIAADITNDDLMDICVANAQSSTVSFFINRGDGKFHGQQPVVVGDFCNAVHLGKASPDGTVPLITTHTRTNNMAVTNLFPNLSSGVSSSVPTGRQPRLVAANTKQDGRLEMLVQSREERNSVIGMSLFEEYQEGKFIERSLRANSPHRVVAMASNDLRNTKSYDLVVMRRSERSDSVSLMVGFAKNQFDFPELTTITSFIDSAKSSFLLLTGKVNEDAWPDILFFVGPPERSMGIVYARGHGEFADTVSWIHEVQPFNEDCVILDDVNTDNRTDIIYLDAEKQSVMVAYQRIGGAFRSPVLIQPATGVRAIQVSSLKRSGIRDLILSHADKGKISIVFDPFRNP